MDLDPEKIEQAVLALLGAFEFEHGRVWKGYDFDVMKRLFEKGYITDPVGKGHSVYITEEGQIVAHELAQQLLGRHSVG
jgi:hypothetical protein